MSSSSIHNSRDRAHLLVFFVLITAFIVTWALMFVHPGAAVLVFWLGLCVFGGSALADRIAERAERRQGGREQEGTGGPR
jgi:hypothetical protein